MKKSDKIPALKKESRKFEWGQDYLLANVIQNSCSTRDLALFETRVYRILGIFTYRLRSVE